MAEMITVELEFVKDAPTYVEGIDSRGFPRAFEKATHEFRIKGDKLFVDVDKRAWERRMKRLPVVKPTKQVTTQKKVGRKCLICKHTFHDQPQIRICAPCKKTAAWQSGDMGGDY